MPKGIFSASLENFGIKTTKNIKTVQKKSIIGLCSAVILDTPVDSGRLRNNWFPEINSFSDEETKHTGAKGAAAIARAITKYQSFKLGDTYTLTNNMPYAIDIEYGLYPNPVKFGTPVKGHKPIRYEVRTINGYSAKAPKGMVRINIMRWTNIVYEEARKLNG